MTSSFPRTVRSVLSVADLVKQVAGDAVVVGNDTIQVESVASLEDGGEGTLAFCRYVGEKAANAIAKAPAQIIVARDIPNDLESKCFIQTTDPRGWFIDALRVLLPSGETAAISPTAIIHENARIGKNVAVGVHTHIGPEVEISDNCTIGDFCSIVGATSIAEKVIIGSHASIGSDGLAFHERPDGTRAFFMHLGRVEIGCCTSIGSHAAIMRGILEDTVIGENCMIGNHTNVGHNARLGDRVYLSSGVKIAGAAEIGDDALLGTGALVSSHISVGAGAVVGIGAVVVKPVSENLRVFGNPAKPLPAMRKF